MREVGKNMDADFLHGTHKSNVGSLAAPRSGPVAGKQNTGRPIFDAIAPAEQNEFGAELLLSERQQAHQAVMFAQGKDRQLAVVSLKPGTRVLDLSDEATRAPRVGFGGEPEVLRFFERPAITDDFIQWRLGKISDGYKARNPNWRELIAGEMDPASPQFSVQSWREHLVKYARDRGWGAIRLADETLVVDRGVISASRAATGAEAAAARTARRYPGSKASGLFTEKPTGARRELEK